MELDVNHRPISVDCGPAASLLWALRDHLNPIGTKFDCGIAACGAYTVYVDGAVVRLCVLPVTAMVGEHITTIEGLVSGEGKRHMLQQARIDEQVPQYGYCQSGTLVAAADLLTQRPDPTDADIDMAMTNICRCGTYPRMYAVVKHAVRALREGCA